MKFNVYNPNVNLLSVVSLEFEFTPAAGVVPRYNMFAFTLYRSLNTAYHGFLLCFLLFFSYNGRCSLFRSQEIVCTGEGVFYTVLEYTADVFPAIHYCYNSNEFCSRIRHALFCEVG